MHDPRVPETLEGWSVLHQMFRVRWDAWRELAAEARSRIASEAADALQAMDQGETGTTALSTLLGHKGELMLLHFRRSFDALQAAQLQVSGLGLSRYLEATTSYVSVVELGMYEMTAQIHGRLAEKGLAKGSPEFEKAFDAEMEEQRRRVVGRLFQDVPKRRYVCFYPMNKKRKVGENWFLLDFDSRSKLMAEHGRTGMTFGGKVTQLITVGLGFDDWEWGVTLWARNPEFLKDIVYRMRFDEASARYAEFGPFYVSYVVPPAQVLEHCRV